MLVAADKKSGDLFINLPSKAREYESEAQQALFHEFAYEEVNRGTIERMNKFLADWLKERGVEVLLEESP